MVHHVWARSLDGRDLFVDPDDRRDIVARFSRVLPECGVDCFGWTLMSNHVHLVLKTGAQRIGTVMKRVFTGYAMRFNGRAGRRGYLFQGRFGSRPVRDEGDLLGVIRYVLRNPIEAGLVRSIETLEGYPWGAYSALVGRRDAYDFESVAATLRLFGPDEAAGRRALRAWLERPPPADEASPLDALIRRTCLELGVDEAELRAGRRTRPASRARALICRRAVGDLELRVSEVARALGLCHAAVCQAARRSPQK
jgi:REP element-mobilizing transposase RayT